MVRLTGLVVRHQADTGEGPQQIHAFNARPDRAGVGGGLDEVTDRLLHPRVAVPIHWGTFLPIGRYRRYHALLHTPVERFRMRAAEQAPDTRLEVLEPGGSLVIPAITPPG